MKYLPINIKLKNQLVVVLGGGSVATRKIKSVLNVAAQVVCLSDAFNNDIKQLAQSNQLTLIKHDLNDIQKLDDFSHIRLIISATSNPKINAAAYNYAQLNHIWINTVDQQELCDFLTPAIVDRSPVVVAISTEGASPVLARIIKQKIEFLMPFDLGRLAIKARALRALIKSSIPSFNNRRRFWEQYFNWSHLSKSILPQEFKTPNGQTVTEIISTVNNTQGKVSLVGAGPGNPELLTLKAIKVLQTADVVLHDQLISNEILKLVRKDAKLINVGKQAGHHKTKQENINQQLIQGAQSGLHVCRLKGGDSFVFGRGGEEVLALNAKNIEFEIVPGITAAVGCAAYAGIPLTHRDHAQSLAFITAHCSDSIDTIDWQFYAKNKQTLAVYMGLIKADLLVSQLTKHGKQPNEWVAIIENGTRENQRTVTGQLNQLPAMIISQQIKSPALIVIGSVAQYANQLDWYKPHTKHSKFNTYLKSA
ncbi:siroheme synthase CysG [Marinicella litoralis]|uniref:Uroporphyrinogen-III C-methyltransferase /precorrin-2 dehydrogenase n=1 Tax=Marinicella litoralis TaxID=644220 RepID=A0A4R6XHX5_9GAMM|nr:siroheme synthase CysG [Marinicella litoralis]TDR17480.1 uroporphyrinogen-III C-methyltransferase /precorrin-2 dehydrogenase [Marinicella litoralis]